MQYNVPKNTNETTSVANDFEGTIRKLLTYIKTPIVNDDFSKIGAIEFILSDDVEETIEAEQILIAMYLFDAIHK
ncbi:hypothetical protein [Clostridium estertheticum]|uniref:hypothetical protein n=1 Tax=Clostridium estertheticum TaxID=238834 RepID=UPI001CF2EB10|nr:hypothetical protein [Clostridium estertheticum]MCB2361993.1 hypothetical protein [Clostridium estertheticum]